MASTWIKERHDIAITNIGTDGAGTDLIGMMLVKDPKTKAPLWRVLDGKSLADQFFTGVPSQEYTDPEQEILLSQSDWRSGFGLEIHDINDAKRYFESYGMDLRFRGGAILSNGVTALTKPTTMIPCVRDPELDIWTDANTLTYWTKAGAGVLDREATEKYSGSYSAKTTGIVNLVQNVVDWAITMRGVVFTFTCWVKTSTANHVRIAIADVDGTNYSSYHTGGGGWKQLTATRTVGANATACNFYLFAEQALFTAYFDLVNISATVTDTSGQGIVVAFAEFNSNLYCAMGKLLCKLNTTTGASLTPVRQFAATITDLEPFTDNKLYIGQGLSEPCWYMDTGETCTQSNAVVNKFNFFKAVHSATPTMWGSDSAYTLRSTVAPANGGTAWSSQTTVGSSGYDITALVTKSGALYIMKEDMPYYLNSAGAVQNDLAPELQTCTATTSGKNAKVWRNKVYIPAGTQALLETDGTTNTFINPGDYCTNSAIHSGRVQALAYDETFLFAAMFSVDHVYILTGREETIDGATAWHWHDYQNTSQTSVECMFVSTVYQKRLYITSSTASEAILYLPLPTGYANLTADSNRAFATGGNFITPFVHGQFQNTNKAFIKLTVTLGHAYDANIYISAAYEKLGDSSWTSIGNLVGTSANRVASAFIPVDGSSNKPVSTMMRFKFTGVTNDTTKTPILVQYTVQAILYPTIKTLYFCSIDCREDITTKQGVIDRNMYDTIITTLDNARNPAIAWPISIRDIDGNTKTVKFLPLPQSTERYVITRDEQGREMERVYNLLMEEVTLS